MQGEDEELAKDSVQTATVSGSISQNSSSTDDPPTSELVSGTSVGDEIDAYIESSGVGAGGSTDNRSKVLAQRSAQEAEFKRTLQQTGLYKSREDWKAEPPDLSKINYDWDYRSIVIHHAGDMGSLLYSSPKTIQRAHMSANSADIAYHFAIDSNGTIFEGRNLIFQGAHAGKGIGGTNQNPGRIGIVLLGDYSRSFGLNMENPIDRAMAHADSLLDLGTGITADELTEAQLGSLVSLIMLLKMEFPQINELGGHKDYRAKPTDCPGVLVYDNLPLLREATGLGGPEE